MDRKRNTQELRKKTKNFPSNKKKTSKIKLNIGQGISKTSEEHSTLKSECYEVEQDTGDKKRKRN